MKKAMLKALLVMMTGAVFFLAIFYHHRQKCRRDVERDMAFTGYTGYEITAVRFSGIKCGRVYFDGGSAEYGLWLLFSPSVVDAKTGQTAFFDYDPRLRRTPGFDYTRMMPVVSWQAQLGKRRRAMHDVLQEVVDRRTNSPVKTR